MASKKQHRNAVLLPDFSAHNLRHTFCTRLCEKETNLKVIQSVMGHKDIQTTMDIYAEATEQKNKNRLNDWLQNWMFFNQRRRALTEYFF